MEPTRAVELRDLLERARRAWPTVDVPDEVFFAHVEARSGDEALDRLSIGELYLAAGCATGVPGAIEAFERSFGAELAAIVRRTSSSVDVDDVLQKLRESLFVSRPPKIAEYGGRGELRAWLRVVATRTTLNAATRGPKERAATTDDLELVGRGGETESAELAYFRVHYEAEVEAVLPEAIAVLEPKERLYLRQHYVDQLTLEQMSRMHRVHVATIKRHLSEARSHLSDELRNLLRTRLRLSPSEFESVMAMIRSRFHVSLQRLLPLE